MIGLITIGAIVGAVVLGKRKEAVSGISAAQDWYKRKFRKYDYQTTVELVKDALERQERFGSTAVDVKAVIFETGGTRKQSTIRITDFGNERYLIVSYDNAKRIAFLYELETLFL